jgi:predicted phage terminase large subunit-like protein
VRPRLEALTAEQRAVLCRHDIAAFAAAAFAVVQPGVRYQPAAYLNLLCGKLQQLANGEVRNLIVTLPPRGLKSFLVSVVLPAFLIGRDPSHQVMAVSYGQSLADQHGRDRLKLMRSDFYRSVFGDVLSPHGSPSRFTTPQRGGVLATGIEAAATGLGADTLIFDDPQKAQGALSEAVRTSTNQQLEQTFLSRRNDPQTARVVIVMQRLHEDDFVGHALGLPGMDWELLNLPAIAEEDEVHHYPVLRGLGVFRRGAGESLHPSRFPLDHLQAMRETLGEARFASQYQQRPAPQGGGLVQEKWFKRYAREDLPPRFDEVIQSWDTANTVSEWSDWTVCTTWGRAGQSIYLIHVHRERVLFPDLVRAVRRMDDRFQPDVVLVEDRASGTQLIQTLREAGFGKCRPIKPVADKEIRMTNQTALIESGYIHVPSDADWVQAYLRELILFPNAKHDDQVDSTSQALAYISSWMEHRGLFEHYKRTALPSSAPPRPNLPYRRLRAPSMESSYRGSSGRWYKPGPDGTVWIPEPEHWAALKFGWELVETYDPEDEMDWRSGQIIDWGIEEQPSSSSMYVLPPGLF